jgi:outer membrane protein assembly factor BamB
MNRMQNAIKIALVTVVCLLSVSTLQAQNWSRFRGDNGTGISDLKGVPTSWSAGNYDWNIDLPGIGHAAPIVWGNDLFVTSAENKGVVRYFICLNATTGQTKWTKKIAMSDSHKHNKSSWASSSPVTDGKLVYVAFADQEDYLVNAYTFKGDLVWRRDVGEFDSQHGLGVSLMLHDNMLIVPSDQKGPSKIMALNKHTGKTVWSTLREFRKTSYSTPIIVPDGKGKSQLVCVSGSMGITSLNPANGVMNWRSQGFPLRTVASPVYGEGLLIASCGQGGRYGVQQFAVKASGDLDENGQAKIVWERKKVIPYVPTPVVYKGHLYEWSDEGIVGCVELQTGKNVWIERIGGNYSGSPICIDGKLYCISERGEVVVVAASPEFKELGRTALDDPSHSTPTVANGRLYLRSYHRLAALKAKK